MASIEPVIKSNSRKRKALENSIKTKETAFILDHCLKYLAEFTQRFEEYKSITPTETQRIIYQRAIARSVICLTSRLVFIRDTIKEQGEDSLLKTLLGEDNFKIIKDIINIRNDFAHIMDREKGI